MKRLLLTSIAHMLLLAQLGDACAASLFDGEWTGSATSTVGRCKPASITLTVQATDVVGQARFEVDGSNINRTVRADGRFGAAIGLPPLTGNYTHNGLEGTFRSVECVGHMLLK